MNGLVVDVEGGFCIPLTMRVNVCAWMLLLDEFSLVKRMELVDCVTKQVGEDDMSVPVSVAHCELLAVVMVSWDGNIICSCP